MLNEKFPLKYQTKMTKYLIGCDNLELLIYCHQSGYQLHWKICLEASRKGHLEIHKTLGKEVVDGMNRVA